eukprot:7466874-Pyramimonas_sp.AAC.1
MSVSYLVKLHCRSLLAISSCPMSRLQEVSALQYNPRSASSYDRLQDILQTTNGFDIECLTGTGARRYGTEE